MAISKLIQWHVLSLDGYFEGVKSWDGEWFHSFYDKDQEDFSIEQLRKAKALLFGRVTYEGMAAYWQSANGGGRRLHEQSAEGRLLPHPETRGMEQHTPHTRQRRRRGRKLKREMDGDLFVFGSGQLRATLLEGNSCAAEMFSLEPLEPALFFE